MPSVQGNLGNKDYEIQPLPIKESREWREKFQKPFREIIAAFRVAGNVEVTDGAEVASLLTAFSGILLGSTDKLIDMLFEYSSPLSADRDHIEANATNAEAISAFVEVLKLAYPFSAMFSLTRALTGNIQTGPWI